MLQKKIIFSLLLFCACNLMSQTIVDTHGRLRVQGNQIVDQSLNPTSIAGNSLFWSNAGDTANYYNAQTVNHLADDWNSSLIRCAMGVNEPWDGGNGFINSPAAQEAKIRTVIDAAIAKGIYVIIDWHTHEAELYEDEAVEFFTKMAQIYGDQPNVMYEIYNEPINQSWSTIKNYAEAVIAGIRSEDPDNLIIVGTPFYSQEVDVASLDPINDANTAYTLHFYAGTHGNSLRNKATTALNNGIALFATEWGTVDADGTGSPNNQNTQTWMDFLEENNISHANWAVSDKNEGASIVQNGNGINGLVNGQLTASGNLVRNIIRNWSPSTTTGSSEVNFTTPSGNSTVQQGYTSLEIEATGTVSGGSISSMSLFINDALVRQENVAPYEWGNGNNSDETLGLSVGTHDFRVVMRDNNGNFYEDQFVLTVTSNSQGGGSSEVNFTTPSGNRTVQQGYTSLEIEATGTVSGGSISNMSLFIDDALVRQENFAPYEWGNGNNSDETLGLSVGAHDFRVVMRDSNGNFYEDQFVLTVTSNNQGEGTAVNFITPAGNRTVQQGYNSLRIEAVGNVNNGSVSRMSLLIDNQFIRHEFIAPYEWGIGNSASETLGLSVGTHVIRVIMRDNSGNFYDDRFTLTVSRNRNPTETDTNSPASTSTSIIGQARVLEESIKVFPNPANNELFMEGLPNRAGEVQIVDMLGRTVLMKEIGPDNHYVDISTLRSSHYIVLFVYDETVISRKLVKTE